MRESASVTLFLLLCGHALADYGLQTDWMAAHKERPKTGEIQSPTVWPYALAAHSLQHGLMVFLITQKLSLGIAETIVHAVSDLAKGEKRIGFHTDQAIHVVSKFVWLIFLTNGWA